MNGRMRNGSGSCESKALWEAFGAVSFAMDELRLYLDTHPDDEEARALFQSYAERRHELLVQYTNEYGPMDSYFMNTDNGWSWVDEPMPWKAGAN